MNDSTSKKWALITGGAKRLGKAMAEQLHQRGYGVIIQYRSSGQDADAMCEAMNSERADSAFNFQCDLSQPSDLDKLISFTKERAPELSLLINNASSFYPTPVESSSEKEWLDLVDTNLKAPYFLSKGLLPLLKENEGNIINHSPFLV